MDMHTFPRGTKVETNEEYFKTYGRKVIGVSANVPAIPNEITVVRWEFQEGKVIPEHDGNLVMMLSKDLQLHMPN